MSFFKAFLHHAPTESNVSQDSQAENLGIIKNEIEESGPQTEVAQKRKRSAVPSETPSNVEKIISFLDKRHKEYDSIDLTFQVYAASVKKLSDRRQTMLKFKIAKMIMEEELAQQMEFERENQVISSFSNNSVVSSPPTSPFDNSNTVDTDLEAAGDCWYPNSSNDLNL
ncbi:uncharacterized protein LOC123307079 [Coccinella septempunctata]|uniref:uncharacterized protein LOC123307079 n=1 Tax=Coccinella septempunctata TaxID=41139 RepID=UPI001D085F7C|nr:uncharacterized protein LOC123307079 [Coccinella septempunctata]